MKSRTLTALIALAVASSGCASAGNYEHADYTYSDYEYNENYDSDYSVARHTFVDKARVIKTTPVYETVRINEPETQCWNEQVRHQRHSSNGSYTPTIAGAILGGVIGNQFGGGKGKDAMTVAGMVLGGAIGNDVRQKSSARSSYVTTEKHCETVDNYRETSELVGYNVKYKFRGENYWTRMASKPGEFIKVRVSLEPAEY